MCCVPVAAVDVSSALVEAALRPAAGCWRRYGPAVVVAVAAGSTSACGCLKHQSIHC